MSYPHCPICHERMSQGEVGLPDVWSCVYCEGAWLPGLQAQSLLEHAGTEDTPAGPTVFSPHGLTCPSCEGVSFRHVGPPAAEACRCTSCGGVFFRKGVLAAVAPELEHPAGMPQAMGRGLLSALRLSLKALPWTTH